MKIFLKKIIFSTLVLILWAGVAWGQAQPTDAQQYERGRECYQEVKSEASPSKNQEQWRHCISIFDTIAGHPDSPYADKAAYSAARLSRELHGSTNSKADLSAALMQYNRVVRDHPDSSLADDALYQIARVRAYQTGERERAKKALQALLKRYPHGDAAPEARRLLVSLEGREGMQQKEKPIADADKVEYETKAEAVTVHFSNQPASSNQPGVLVDLKYQSQGEETIVTLIFDRPVRYSAVYKSGKRTQGSNPTLTVMLKETYARIGLPERIEVGSTTVREVAVGPRLFGGTKVHFDLNRGSDYELTQYRGSLDLTFKRGSATEGQMTQRYQEGDTATAAAIARPKPQKKETGGFWSKLFSRKPKEEGPRPLRVVIDPGHGGEEDGAIGPHGIREKDITLEIAKKLKQNLERDLGAKVWLTRKRDKTVSLEKRNKIARKKKADLFISIHANASNDSEHRGMETYYLNNATDEAALRLAARENISWKGPTADIDNVLSTMLQNAVTDESRELANSVHTSIVKTLNGRYENVRDRGVRSALFYVLVGTKSPGILVETSFITNPREEMRLVDPTYQENVATAITHGVKDYLSKSSTRFSSL